MKVMRREKVWKEKKSIENELFFIFQVNVSERMPGSHPLLNN